uniref:DegT/DnrJ/EryC1/StrS aminotransferase n=1 Tax=Rhodopseudomonas palustris (strain DX-1) TaxID=652103 RepID=E6VP93_RHOPX
MPRVGFSEWLALTKVVARGQLLRYRGGEQGYTTQFEQNLEKQIGVKHALTVNSGTSALISALAAAGIGPGDEVLVPAYTWVATAIAPLMVGAVPIVVDVNESLTIDPEDIKRKITPYTKAIMPVHMLNLVCDMDAIVAIAREHRLKIIEDACQAVGLVYKGRRVGTIGDAGAYSFNQFKNLNSGEGGAVLTNDDRLFTRARMYHDAGSYTREYSYESNEAPFTGMNFKVSELTGAVLYAQLPKLDPLISRLRARYPIMVKHLSQTDKLRISPHNDPENAAGLTVILDTADDAKKFAQNRGVDRLIDTGRHVYTNWRPIMTQRTFDDRMNPWKWAKRDIQYSEDMCSRTLDILSRTCRVSLGPQYPIPFMEWRGRSLLKALS